MTVTVTKIVAPQVKGAAYHVEAKSPTRDYFFGVSDNGDLCAVFASKRGSKYFRQLDRFPGRLLRAFNQANGS